MLGKIAVEKFVAGVDLLGKDESRLLEEFDYGVLVALRDVTKILDRGVESVRVEYRGESSGIRYTKLDKRVRERVGENITSPTRSAV